MKHTPPALLFVTAAFLGGYGFGRWHANPGVSAHPPRRILFYQSPMHPSYRSSSPGTAPCCHMALQPVYEDAMPAASTNAIRITPQQQELLGVKYGTAEYTPAYRSIRGAARVGLDETRLARVQTKLDGFIDQLYVKSG